MILQTDATGNVYVEATRVSIVGLRIKRLVLDFSLLTSRHLERKEFVGQKGKHGLGEFNVGFVSGSGWTGFGNQNFPCFVIVL